MTIETLDICIVIADADMNDRQRADATWIVQELAGLDDLYIATIARLSGLQLAITIRRKPDQ